MSRVDGTLLLDATATRKDAATKNEGVQSANAAPAARAAGDDTGTSSHSTTEQAAPAMAAPLNHDFHSVAATMLPAIQLVLDPSIQSGQSHFQLPDNPSRAVGALASG